MLLGSGGQSDRYVWTQPKGQPGIVSGDVRIEQAVRRLLESGVHFGEGCGKCFPGAHQEWHPGPSLVLYREPRGYVGFDSRICCDTFLGQIAAILATHDLDRTKRTYRLE